MGRTLPAATQLMLQMVPDLAPLYDAVTLQDKIRFDRMFEPLVEYKAAFNNSSNILPLEVFLGLAILHERKRNDSIIDKILALIDKLIGKNNAANLQE